MSYQKPITNINFQQKNLTIQLAVLSIIHLKMLSIQKFPSVVHYQKLETVTLSRNFLNLKVTVPNHHR